MLHILKQVLYVETEEFFLFIVHVLLCLEYTLHILEDPIRLNNAENILIIRY